MKVNTFCSLVSRQLVIFFLSFSVVVTSFSQKGNDPEKMFFKGFIWPNQTPGECPFKQSAEYSNLYFTGRNSDYYAGDTWYPSWASDGNLYSPYADGTTDGVTSYAADPTATTGNAILIGDDPQNLVIKNTSKPQPAAAFPYGGRYPCGSLLHNGVWYYGTYLLGITKTTIEDGYHFGWPVLGPMPGFRTSTDYGKTWIPSPLTPDKPLFPEPRELFGAVKIGAPHFVDFGKNMEHSPDGKAYMVCMGAEDDDPLPRYANLSWISADQVYLIRVTPSIENINNIEAYEFFAGYDSDGSALWSGDFEDIKPLLDWNNHMGCVTVTYNAPLKKYFMCVTEGWRARSNMDSYIMESDNITGPWKMVTYMQEFGTQGYFLNFPSKFISDDGKTMWLCYSGNYGAHRKLPRKPPNGRYGLNFYEVKLLGKDKQQFEATKAWENNLNIASLATIEVSSKRSDIDVSCLINGKVCQHKNGIHDHWISAEDDKAWVKLSWDKPQIIRSIRLFDCVDRSDHVKFGYLEFSNGRKIPIEVPQRNSSFEGLDIFWGRQEKVDWIKIVFENVNPHDAGVSLSEIAVFK